MHTVITFCTFARIKLIRSFCGGQKTTRKLNFVGYDSEVILHTSQKTGDRYDDDETANSFRPLGNTGPLCALASSV